MSAETDTAPRTPAATIANLKAQHGEIYLATITPDEDKTASVEIIYRRPTEAEYAKHMGGAVDDPKKSVQLARELASAIVLVPEVKEFSALMDRFGGVATVIAGRGRSLHHAFEASVSKKL